MSNYAPQVQAAYAALKAAGQTVRLFRLGFPTAYDPVNPTTSLKAVQQTTSGAAVVLPASNGTIEAFDNRLKDDPTVKQRFRFVILAGKGLSFIPEAGDVLETAEGFYRVLGSTPLNPNGAQAILYNVGCTTDLEPFIRP